MGSKGDKVKVNQRWQNPDDEHAPALGSEGGIREALGRYRTALDKYRRRRLLPNTVGPYPTDDKPPKDDSAALGSVRPHFTYLP